ncbi:MAG: hypothetical protein CVT49_11200 [candidate division Zixibacteria bacterium HGW-Zixibacteria-1]|nr:MAG: hypothetical protein CVT49_11200 [candidate division Zixibacteria bacterium HGW-Zixibacteria-1]
MSLGKILKYGVAFLAAGMVLGAWVEVALAEEVIVDMRGFYEGDLVVDGFELKSETRLSIYAIGAQLKQSDDMYAYGWIINADSREPVWVLNEQETRRYKKTKNIREYKDEITLPAGRYEIYYYAGKPYFLGDINISIGDLEEAIGLLDYIFRDDDEKYEYYSEDIEDLALLIKAPDGSFTKFNPIPELCKDVVIDFTRPEAEFAGKKGFTLKKEMTLKIEAIGEYISDDRVFVDFGWIIDADSRKRVWQMDKWNTSWAGGGRKNRGFDGDVTLPAGNYVAYFVTDDSHSFGDWNVMPPYDPLHYGMLVSFVKEGEAGNVSEYVDDYTEPIVVQINRVGNDQFKSQGFTLKKDAGLHIVALGEFGYQDDFVDYGWIENLDDGNIVWEMKEEDTQHAGGSKKNRRFDGIVTLPAGNYMAFYVTDGSHAYRRWNESAPFEPTMWGITIYGAGKKFDASIVKTFDELPPNTNTLVNLTGIGDGENVRKSFKLDRSQKVHIFALGEGKGGEMYDFGWIENSSTGNIIWEMTYRKTRHAGGDQKNRKVDTYITLEPGEYDVYFETDDSHSFPNFNASRPDQPHKWGITITKE